jgi:hypothetical protein
MATLAEWTGAAANTTTKRKPKAQKPWERHDREAAATVSFSLRLNEYERTLLESVAKESGRSMQKEAKRLLLQGLARAARGPKTDADRARDEPESDPE